MPLLQNVTLFLIHLNDEGTLANLRHSLLWTNKSSPSHLSITQLKGFIQHTLKPFQFILTPPQPQPTDFMPETIRLENIPREQTLMASPSTNQPTHTTTNITIHPQFNRMMTLSHESIYHVSLHKTTMLHFLCRNTFTFSIQEINTMITKWEELIPIKSVTTTS